MSNQTRRIFLARALILGGAGGAALLLGRCGGQAGSMSPGDLSALLAGNEAVNGLGRTYMGLHPEEGTVTALTGALAASAGTEGLASPERVAALIREDYAERRTVIAGGWVLSMTEGRLCALAALEKSTPATP
jgi:hypothetical protein